VFTTICSPKNRMVEQMVIFKSGGTRNREPESMGSCTITGSSKRGGEKVEWGGN